MKLPIIISCFAFLVFACNTNKESTNEKNTIEMSKADSILFKSGFADVNGLKMYYEIYGKGSPLVLIHGGGSTIQTTFGRIIPELFKNHQLIAVELQAHGRTSDRDTDLSFEQDADDVVALLKSIGIAKADFLGFSNGGNTTMQIAIRHPEVVTKIIVGSALYKRSGAPPQFWEFMKQATLDHMPKEYKDAYTKVAPVPGNLQIMHDKCAKRMAEFKDWSGDQLKSISVPTLLIVGNKDVMTPEHALDMYRLIPDCRIAVLPGGHGDYIGEITTVKSTKKEQLTALPIIEQFLLEPIK